MHVCVNTRVYTPNVVDTYARVHVCRTGVDVHREERIQETRLAERLRL